MKFPPFEYAHPASLAEATDQLAADEDARALAGGQSLLPLMALRLARPSTLVDIGGVVPRGVEHVGPGRGALRIGALTTQTELLSDPLIGRFAPLVAAAAAHVGHPAIRNRGTLGGSLAHGDPAAELPAALVALGGSVDVTGPGGDRSLSCAELIDGYFVNTLVPGELITSVVVPMSGDGAGAAWCEWALRSGDFAEVGIGVSLAVGPDGLVWEVRAASCGVGGRPVDLAAAMTGVHGARGDEPDLLRQVASLVANAAVEEGGDGDRAELAGMLAARALRRAYVRANGERPSEVTP